MKRIALITGNTNASDRAAVGLALCRLSGEVRAYSFNADAEALGYAVAAGAVSGQLAADAAEVTFDVALVGGGAAPDDSLAATLAAAGECPLLLEVLDVAWVGDGLRVTRDLGRGARQVLRINGRAVLGISEEAPNLLYVSRRKRTANPPTENLKSQIHDFRSTSLLTWEPARLRTRTVGIRAKTGGSATDRASTLFGVGTSSDAAAERQIINADAATCARYLLRYLAHNGFIDAARAGDAVAPPVSPQPIDTRAQPSRTGTALNQRLARGPRPLGGVTAAMARRPRPVSTSGPHAGKLSRGPRPVGQASPARLRGPFGVNHG